MSKKEAVTHEAFWNGLFDTRWDDAHLGAKAEMIDRGF